MTRVKKFAETLGRENDTLQHIDLTGCNLTMEEITLLGEELKENHTLFGIHLGGNCGYHNTDAFGFLGLEEFSCENTIEKYDYSYLRSGECTWCWS